MSEFILFLTETKKILWCHNILIFFYFLFAKNCIVKRIDYAKYTIPILEKIKLSQNNLKLSIFRRSLNNSRMGGSGSLSPLVWGLQLRLNCTKWKEWRPAGWTIWNCWTCIVEVSLGHTKLCIYVNCLTFARRASVRKLTHVPLIVQFVAKSRGFVALAQLGNNGSGQI